MWIPNAIYVFVVFAPRQVYLGVTGRQKRDVIRAAHRLPAPPAEQERPNSQSEISELSASG